MKTPQNQAHKYTSPDGVFEFEMRPMTGYVRMMLRKYQAELGEWANAEYLENDADLVCFLMAHTVSITVHSDKPAYRALADVFAKMQGGVPSAEWYSEYLQSVHEDAANHWISAHNHTFNLYVAPDERDPAQLTEAERADPK